MLDPAAQRAPIATVLFDARRQRGIPILLYEAGRAPSPEPLAVLSHGYGGHNDDYSFVDEALVRRGFVVASIEHVERPDDPAMAKTGDLALLRRPVWQIGADTIGFVVDELARADKVTPTSRQS